MPFAFPLRRLTAWAKSREAGARVVSCRRGLCPPCAATIVKASKILSVNTRRSSPVSQASLRWRRWFDLHVLRMTAITVAAQLLHVLPELVGGAGLTGIISGGRRVFGDAIEGIKILPYRKRCRGGGARAVRPYA